MYIFAYIHICIYVHLYVYETYMDDLYIKKSFQLNWNTVKPYSVQNVKFI